VAEWFANKQSIEQHERAAGRGMGGASATNCYSGGVNRQGETMGPSREERHDSYVAKARAELESLGERGVLMAGNAFSSVLLIKGESTTEERAGGTPFAGEDGAALRAALQALGFAPEDWSGLAAWDETGASLDAPLLREAICALDPATCVVCDAAAANLVREAFADDLASLESFDEAMLVDGVLAQVAGMRMMSLGGFAASLADKHQKQVMWRRLKQLPPLGEPY
jgi:hypothetical protein